MKAKKWLKGTLIGIIILAAVAMVALRFGNIAIPSALWLTICLVGHGALMFLLMGMFTQSGSDRPVTDTPEQIDNNTLERRN